MSSKTLNDYEISRLDYIVSDEWLKTSKALRGCDNIDPCRPQMTGSWHSVKYVNVVRDVIRDWLAVLADCVVFRLSSSKRFYSVSSNNWFGARSSNDVIARCFGIDHWTRIGFIQIPHTKRLSWIHCLSLMFQKRAAHKIGNCEKMLLIPDCRLSLSLKRRMNDSSSFSFACIMSRLQIQRA